MEQKSFTVEFAGETIPAHYITDPTTASKAFNKLMAKDCLFGIDTETAATKEFLIRPGAALSPFLSRIRLLQVYDGKQSIVFDMRYIPYDMPVPFLETKKFVGHNSIFDLKFFMQMGVKKMDIGCTFLASKLLHHALFPTDEGLSASLKAMANTIFKQEILKELQASDWAEPDLTFEQVQYAALDPVTCYKLALKLSSGIKRLGLERIYDLCRDAQHPIAAMELNGIGFDAVKHRSMIPTWRDDLWSAKKKCLQVTGLDDLTGHKLAGWLEKNLPKDVLNMWPRTDKTDKLKTDSHVFADFGYLDIVEPFEKYQKAYKLTSSFGDSLIGKLNPSTRRLHPSYKICGARTGRLSCTNPNLQQIPRGTSIRDSFTSLPGFTFVCADYSQIELRVGAELSQDEQMLSAYRKGIDLHQLTASQILKKKLSDVTKEDRQLAKAYNFGLMFGLGANKFSHYARKSYGVEVTRGEATDAIETFRETYSGYRDWQLRQAEAASTTGTCVTPCGKLRKLPRDNIYGNSMNHPVQGGAAEVMLHALIRVNEAGLKLVNCVHDEIMIEVPDTSSKVLESTQQLESCMVKGFQDVFPGGIINGLVEAKVGDTWAKAK